MGWWKQLFGGATGKSLDGTMYRVATTLYSPDGKRSAEVREFDNGQTYLLEREWVEGTIFEERHEGRMVGPFRSPRHAERFVVATAWFNGAE
ncbi:hypothetical protein [Rhodovulum sp. PH10]|uniref:hypothetical protein n=1 Tax=Rhodovulum sp. PH10 TaxID=1187851 RepID=UPI0012F98729|nr:hypothetical protein [Rhodovulum sp. PH10]